MYRVCRAVGVGGVVISAECCAVSVVMLEAVIERERASASTICASDAVGVIHCRMLKTLHGVAN